MKRFVWPVIKSILICISLVGCQLVRPVDAIYWIEKGDAEKDSYLSARDCELLDKVVGAYGDDDAYLSIFVSDGFLRSSARDDLKDKALALGANTISITDHREYKKQLKTRLGLFKVEIHASVFRCVA